jgi:geranylgeranyl reductase family protein
MSETINFDIIIIGAGPAGSIAALYARRNNLRTLLLEKDIFPRDKICGDAISGKSMSILDELDLLNEAQQLPGSIIDSIIFGSPANHTINIDLQPNHKKNIPAGLVIKREIFDTFLFNKAKSSADACFEGFKVTEILKKNNFVNGVKGVLKETSEEKTFYAPIVLGADGYNSILARNLGLYDHDSKHWVVALRQYFKNIDGLNRQLEIHYIKEAQPGYFWIFPLDNGFANVGIGMLHETIKSRKIDLKQVLTDTINSPAFKERFKNAQAMEKPKGWNLPVGSKHRKNHGNGFMLLGDAAGLIDPFTGEGIGNALYSAKYAVETAAKAIKNNNCSESVLAEYDRILWKRLGNELAVSTKLQKVGRMQSLLNFVIGKAERNTSVRDIISGMMRNDIPKQQLANPLFYLKLLFT